MKERKYILKKTWIDVKTGKEKGGYFYFYSTVEYEKFKFYKTLGKQTVFTSLKEVRRKIDLFNLSGVSILIVELKGSGELDIVETCSRKDLLLN